MSNTLHAGAPSEVAISLAEACSEYPSSRRRERSAKGDDRPPKVSARLQPAWPAAPRPGKHLAAGSAALVAENESGPSPRREAQLGGLPRPRPRTPHKPLKDMGPGATRPALSRSSVRLDQELRAIADAILAEFVRPWFSTFSDDQEFYAEVIGCVAYALREVEKRCKKADFVSLLARDVPNLLQQHYADYRRCRSAIGSSLSGHRSVEELFLGLRPHFALAGSVTENREEEYVRQLSDSLLLVLLPLEEYTSECTRYLLREIVGRRVLLSLVDMLSEPDFVNELVVKLFPTDSEAIIQNVVETEEESEMGIRADDDRYQLASLKPGRTPRTFAENGSSSSRRMPSLKGKSSTSSNSSDAGTRPLVAQATSLDARRHAEVTAMRPVSSNSQNFRRTARTGVDSSYSNIGAKLKSSSSSQFAPTVAAVASPSRPKPPPFVFQIDIFTIMWQIVVGQIRWIWATVCVFFLHIVTYVPFLRRASRSAGFDAIVSGSPSVVLPGQRRASLAELLGADHSSLDEPLVALLSEMFALPTQNWRLSTQLEFFVLPPLRVLSGGAIDWWGPMTFHPFRPPYLVTFQEMTPISVGFPG